jgi:transcriptional regulator with XRE-family HTH domain
MARLTLEQLGEGLRRNRGERGIRETAREIGISSATLSRIERGNVPDLETFAKVCRWLKVDPAEVLGVETAGPSARVAEIVASAHFRADQTPSPELARALAEMILAAHRMMARQAPTSDQPR